MRKQHGLRLASTNPRVRRIFHPVFPMLQMRQHLLRKHLTAMQKKTFFRLFTSTALGYDASLTQPHMLITEVRIRLKVRRKDFV